jgi:asparagine synthase (glutamine-hydrolysing)
MPIRDAVRGAATEVWDGIGGDALPAGLFLNAPAMQDYERGNLDLLADRLLYGWNKSEALIQHCLSKEFRTHLSLKTAKTRIISELAVHANSHNPLTSFHFWNRTRREIALYSFSMYEGIAQPVAPYLDNDVVNLLLGLPAIIIADGRFHTETIAATYPQWADIGYERAEDAPFDRSYWRRYYLDCFRHFALTPSGQLYSRTKVAGRLLHSFITLKAPWFSTTMAHYLSQVPGPAPDTGRTTTFASSRY